MSQHADVLVCSANSSLGSLLLLLSFLFTKSGKECTFNILTVAWHLSNHPLDTVRKGCLQWLHSCIWSESNKTILDVIIPYLLTFNTQLLFQCRRAVLEELIQKTKVLAKDGTRLESCHGKLLVFNSLRCFASKVSASGLSRIKNQDERKKMQHLDIKRQNLVFILPTGRAPKHHFPLLVHNRWKR